MFNCDPSVESSCQQFPTEFFHHYQPQHPPPQEELYNTHIQPPPPPPLVHYPSSNHAPPPSLPHSGVVGYCQGQQPQQPGYDFAYCETQWTAFYNGGQHCGQYEAYCFREAYRFSPIQVDPCEPLTVTVCVCVGVGVGVCVFVWVWWRV